MKLSIPIAVMLLVSVVFSCNKDDDKDDDRVKTKMELITAGPWKRTALTSDPAYDWYGDGTFATDILSVMELCEKDNWDTYKANRVWELDEGATKCDPLDPQTWTLGWTFADNESKLIFDGTDEYTLMELTETTLKFRSTFVENGVTYTQVESYGH